MLTKIDAIRDLAIGHATLQAGLEQPRYNPADHLLYLPDQTKNLLYQIDPDRIAVTRQWNLGVPCSPTGMAIEPKHAVAMIGCADAATAWVLVWDLKAGKLVKKLTDIGSVDQDIHATARDTLLAAGGRNGTPPTRLSGGFPVAPPALPGRLPCAGLQSMQPASR